MFSDKNSNLEKLEQEIKTLKAQLEAEREKGAAKDAIISEATRSLKENAARAIEIAEIGIDAIESLRTVNCTRMERRGLEYTSFGNEMPNSERLREEIETVSERVQGSWEMITKELPQAGKLEAASTEVVASSRGQGSSRR